MHPTQFSNMHKFKNYFDLIYDSYMRCMIAYLDLKISFNMIHDLYMRYEIPCYDLNFCLDLNLHIYIYIYMGYILIC